MTLAELLRAHYPQQVEDEYVALLIRLGVKSLWVSWI